MIVRSILLMEKRALAGPGGPFAIAF